MCILTAFARCGPARYDLCVLGDTTEHSIVDTASNLPTAGTLPVASNASRQQKTSRLGLWALAHRVCRNLRPSKATQPSLNTAIAV